MSDALDRLRTLGSLREADLETLEGLVIEVGSSGDPAGIPVLLGLLDDDSPFTGTMETIQDHAALLPGFVGEFVNLLPSIGQASPMWTRVMVGKMLNTPKYLGQLQTAAQVTTGDAREALRRVLLEIVARGGRQKDAAQELADKL